MYVVELPRLKIVAVGAYALVGVHSVWLSGAGPTQAAAAERLLRAAGIRILSVTESGRPE